MNSYSFEYPYLLLLLPLLLYCLYKCREFAKPRYFVHLHFLRAKKSFKHLELLLKAIVVTTLVIALCSPIIVDKSDPLNREGKEIVLAIDASGSMNASGFDVDDTLSKGERLSRFELTKIVAREFILNREEDNIGVVVYGDFAFIASPITYEKEILSDMLEYLTQGLAGQNTAIGEAIAMSVRAFEKSKAKSKLVILLSDGEHNSGAISPKDALVMAQEQNIKIYTIGIGKAGEADGALLEKIAKESGGEYYYALSAKELQEVYAKIDDLESSNISAKEYKSKRYLYATFLLIAIMALLALLYREFRK
ncbi:MAG: VWA domain-containing protein [Campylobacterales bacterium]|nr:VWA domain-containing protein [Campylobacterales bacterium]